MVRQSVLVVDDDSSIRQLISVFLRANNLDVSEAWSVQGARRMLASKKFDAMVLDLELDDGEGFEVLRDERAKAVQTVVVSSRQLAIDRVVSLELGADDYVTKPIDLRELLLRLRRSLLRARAAPSTDAPADVPIDRGGHVTLDVAERAICRDGRPLCKLSGREFKLLRLFLAGDQSIIDRDRIARDALDWRSAGDSRAVDMLVSKLRKKIGLAGGENAIKNIRGEGYMFDANNIV
jgi:two-component system OmpR family response regulator